MKLSLNWLQTLVDVDMTVAELDDALTMAGLEVEGVEAPFEHLDAVTVGRIFDITPHPGADKLRLCKVDIGTPEPLSVVCGAPNIYENMRAPLAPAGTVMPDGTKLKKGKIRGEVSEGMLCSASELAIDGDASGILDLPKDAEVGTSLPAALGLDDTVLEIGLTPNRVDCASVMGLAREVAFLGKKALKKPETGLPAGVDTFGKLEDLATVSIEATNACTRFAARLIFDVTVGPSPEWLKARLAAAGLRPINNIVDITNFVMLETGQPLHAYDYDRVAGHRLVARMAKDGETFVTLDDKEHALTAETLMICDGEKPVGIAGIMGGQNSEVSDTTRKIFLEAACFDAPTVRKAARRMGIQTDASYRFERGVDPEGTVYALDRAAALMAELGQGTLVEGLIDENPTPHERLVIPVTADFINKRVGIDLSADEMIALLEAVEFEITRDADTLFVTVPGFRVDVFRKEDISEEVARLYGYNSIPTSFPELPAETLNELPSVAIRHKVQDLMAGFGFREAINYSFVGRDSADKLLLAEDSPLRKTVDLLNPISEDLAVMRTTLVPSMMETVSRNVAQQEKDLRLFEVGNTFSPVEGEALPVETEWLSIALTGNRTAEAWNTKATPCDFFDLKGVVEALFAATAHP